MGKRSFPSAHAADSFDFRPGQYVDQFLGCWNYGSANLLDAMSSTGVCVFNSTYRDYRRYKKKGGDFNIMTNRLSIPLTVPVKIDLAYNLGQ
jgi:hypothetical protein